MEKKINTIIRIAILGAESTGKTTLARSLALRYHTTWVKEYARDYMSAIEGKYSAEDIVAIAKQQLEEEERLIKTANRFIFVDTEFIIAKIWCEDAFAHCPEWLEQQVQGNRYDLYLLTSNDLPWVADPVRVNPQRREYFFNLYKKVLEQNKLPFEIVTGRYETRLFHAINAIQKHFEDKAQ